MRIRINFSTRDVARQGLGAGDIVGGGACVSPHSVLHRDHIDRCPHWNHNLGARQGHDYESVSHEESGCEHFAWMERWGAYWVRITSPDRKSGTEGFCVGGCHNVRDLLKNRHNFIGI